MQEDLSQIEGFLRRNERDIEAIDDEIKGLQGAIAGMQNEIASLSQKKENCLDLSVLLKVRLGQLPPPRKLRRCLSIVMRMSAILWFLRTSLRGWGQRMVRLRSYERRASQ